MMALSAGCLKVRTHLTGYRNQHSSIDKEMHGTKVDTVDRVTYCWSILLTVFVLSIWLPKDARGRCRAVAIVIILFGPYIFVIFYHRRADITDQVEHGDHDRLHIYTVCVCVIFSLPWHSQQIEGTKGL